MNACFYVPALFLNKFSEIRQVIIQADPLYTARAFYEKVF